MKLPLFIFLALSLLLTRPGLLFAIEPEESGFKPVYALVLEDKVNVRSGFGPNFERLTQLDKGSSVVILGQEVNWYKVKLPEQALCFVHRDYVRQGSVTANKLRVRARGSADSNVLGALKKGEQVSVLSQHGEWLRIEPPDSCAGWIRQDFLQPTNKKFKQLPRKRIKPVALKTPPKPAPEKNMVQVQGVIKDMGKIFRRPGTHKLTKGRKTLYYLKSEKVDLNAYVHQKVNIRGKLLKQKKSKRDMIDVQEIEVRE